MRKFKIGDRIIGITLPFLNQTGTVTEVKEFNRLYIKIDNITVLAFEEEIRKLNFDCPEYLKQ